MGKLIAGVLILFAILAGLRVNNSSLFQRNAANQLNGSASATRSTGFSIEATSTSSGAGTGIPLQAASNRAQSQTGTTTETTALPPRQQPAVSGGW